ncbi:MAG: DNA polymerase III subunit gamma and tau [Angustibacter sp.]
MVTTALYRRYRPEVFSDVIGQEHVTEPLMRALRTDRIHHAYLFSGPRGCGKTTSARILARCLNCERGPTDTPCGSCASCVGLSRGGPGTIDVIEIDAASHGGVDDARDLRERASFGPAASRFKVYIIDEAHMVTSAGFNALLKVVEEPPPHVKFVFATTEPDKVIGTIRSRTHHYPFRLVPPARLQEYLAQLCETEQVAVAKGVLPLVVRAGAGSVRDALSVLDQLIAGSEDAGVSYAGAVALLGYTDAALLDAVLDAIAAGDGGTVFRVVDRVVESGHDPRRFVEDLLERLRDLIVVSAAPDDAGTVLRGAPQDQVERMRQQAARFGGAELSRAADITNTALTELTGATAPRLHLELLCARLLLPGADGDRGYGARLDRIERRLAAGSADTSAPAGTLPVAGQAATRPAIAAAEPPSGVDGDVPSEQPEQVSTEPVPEPVAVLDPPQLEQRRSDAPEVAPLGVEAIRQAWPDITARLFGMKKVTFMLVKDAQVLRFDGRQLTVGIASEGAVANFRSGAHAELVQQALFDELAVRAQIEAVRSDGHPSSGERPVTGSVRPATSSVNTGDEASRSPSPDDATADDAVTGGRVASGRAGKNVAGVAVPAGQGNDTAEADAGDADAEDSSLVGQPVVERFLGGRVIDQPPP